MKVITKRVLSLLLALIMLLSAAALPAAAVEQTEAETSASSETETRDNGFNEDWKFYLGSSSSAQNKDFNDSSWETVSIPHDFSISQNFTTSGGTEAESGFLPGGTGWYRKHFTVDAADEGKTFVLNFDGAYENTYVYVNGTYVGENHYGYNSFAFDITDHLLYGSENVIAAKVVHELPSSRWYSGSGIYRDVTLSVTDAIHVAQNGTYITTPNLEAQQNGNVTVNIEAEIVNDSSARATVTVRNTMLNAAGEAVSEPVTTQATISSNATSTVSSTLTVHSPELWSIETPALYYLTTEVITDNQVIDTYETEFGFRYFEFNANTGFYLNGEAVKIKGVCLHHDQGALGAAAYDDAMERQILIMKDMGCNAIRTAHNIADEDFIRLCNKHGMIVMEEAYDGWSARKGSNSKDFSQYFNQTISSSNTILDGESGETWAEFALKAMVKRDRNAPSVILWDIGNEVMNTDGSTSSYVTIAGNLINWVQELDETRPITHGDNKGVVSTSSTHVTAQIDRLLANSGGVVGFNYWAENLATVHRNYPNWKLISTETVSSLNTRGGYTKYSANYGADSSNPSSFVLNAYDNYCVSWGCTAHDGWYNVIRNDCNAGEFIWTGFDYIGEPNPWWSDGTGAVTSLGAAPNSSSFGAVDTAGFAKDRYYFYRSQWNESDTTLHLVTAWDSDNQYLSSRRTPVWIYSNAPKVELYRTDSSGNTVKLATATRKESTTSAGHSYGTYSTTINNSSYCQRISTSGATALSARVNVTYTDGTIYAIAYDANGNVIDNTVGNSRVNTPGTAAKIHASADKEEITADGYSLSYITMDVTDSSGNLDTAATNRIQLSLTGEGEIVGVDNGNPATTRKFQQSSVLTSATTANIDAYAGKALVIVRSTKTGGDFTVTASSSGLSSDSVTVRTVAVPEEEEPEIPVSAITLNQSQVDLQVGATFELTATVEPEDAADPTVTWTTSDSAIASVEDGVITAVAPGTAVITAAAGEFTAQCTVVVAEPVYTVTSVRLDQTSLSLEVGEVSTLTATVLPEEAADTEVIWKSSNEAVVTVQNGTVTAIAAGNATITATAGDHSAECAVSVAEPAPAVTSVRLNQTSLSLEVGEVSTLFATVLPEEAADTEVIWESSNEAVVTVQNGTVTAIGAGNAAITATAGDCSASCTVIVTKPYVPVTGIRLNQTSITLNVGAQSTLTAAVLPSDATDAAVTWESSNEAVATVVNGKVTAIAAGEATITATAGAYSAECLVTVNAAKIAPTVTIDVNYVNSRLVITAQSDIGVNPDLYYTELKHGVLYTTTGLLGSRNMLVTTSGVTNRVVSGFDDDGTFSYSFRPLSGGLSYAYRAYVYYQRPDGTRGYAYSPIIRGTGRQLAK